MVREPESENLEDSVAASGPDPWPQRDSSPEQVNRLVQQEMSHLKALKRLSIGSTFASPGDPDLPDFDSEAEFDMDAHGDSVAFVRKASLQKQRSIRRERSVPTTRRERQKHSQPFMVDNTKPPAKSQDAESEVEPGLDNIWVPAGVHPELAPNEWRTFVTDKLAEIRNSQEQQQQSRGPRHQSRLSHEVADLEEYVDASAILDKRRRSASSGEKRRSILDLSREFVGDSDDVGASHEELPRRNSKRDDEQVIADASQPPDLRPIGGATSLRRSTHRMRRPSQRSALGRSEKPETDVSATASPSSPAPAHDQHTSQRVHSHSHSHAPQTSHHFTPGVASASHARHHSRQRSRTRSLGRPPLSVSISAARAVATTAEQPPSPSAATPSPSASTMLRYRRRKLDPDSKSVSPHLGMTSPEPPKDVPERDPSRPPLSAVISSQGSSLPAQSSPSTSPSESDSDVESAAHPPNASQYDMVDPAHSLEAKAHTDLHFRSRTESNAKGVQTKDVSIAGDKASDVGDSHHAQTVGSTESHTVSPSEAETAISEKAKPRPEKTERRWRWLDSSSGVKEAEPAKESKTGLTLANFFKKRETKRDIKREKEKDRKRERELEQEQERDLEKEKDKEQERGLDSEREQKKEHRHNRELPLTPVSAVPPAEGSPESKQDSMDITSPSSDAVHSKQKHKHSPPSSAADVEAPRRPRGHMRADSRTSNRLAKDGDGESRAPQTVRARGRRKTESIERSGRNEPQEMPSTMAQPEIKLPYDIPAHQISDRSYVMMYHRFPLHIERAIYRLSHMKLANPRRPLRQQVLLSNFMYAYLNLINYGYQQQQLQQFYEQQKDMHGQNGFGGHLEAEQLEQLKRIETKNYDEAMYTSPENGDMESSSSSSSEDEAEMQVDEAAEEGEDEATYLFKTA